MSVEQDFKPLAQLGIAGAFAVQKVRARQKATVKGGGQFGRQPLNEDLAAPPENLEDLLALDEALNRLAGADASGDGTGA